MKRKNVAHLAARKEFKDPIMGLGLGVAFFNSLDINIGYNWPLQSNNVFLIVSKTIEYGQFI